MRLLLRNARLYRDGDLVAGDVAVADGRVERVGRPGELPAAQRSADLEERVLLPGLVNAHDHLDFSSFPPLGKPPYRSAYEWAGDVDGGRASPEARAALAVPHVDRLWLGGLRNLLAGVTAVAHHNPFHRSLQRESFPVRVLARYDFAHSPGLTRALRKTYRTTDRRIPWMVHAAEGVDERSAAELALLREANVLRQNTVLVHGIALPRESFEELAAIGVALVWCPESNLRLYGATAPVAALRAAGVRVGLGSDSPVSGVRDALSNLASARGAGSLGEAELLRLATRGSAEVARLPVGGFEPGDAADFLAAPAIEPLLRGERRAVELVLVRGEPAYGTPALMRQLAPDAAALEVDGAPRRLEAGLVRRARPLLRRRERLVGAAWLAGVGFDARGAQEQEDVR